MLKVQLRTLHKRRLAATVIFAACGLTGWQLLAQENPVAERLSVAELMNGLITPATNTIWGAYQLQSEAEWQAVANAAITVLAAGELLAQGHADSKRADWQTYNNQMLSAARAVLQAVADKDEEQLSAVGNDLLYPPCESCHQQFQN